MMKARCYFTLGHQGSTTQAHSLQPRKKSTVDFVVQPKVSKTEIVMKHDETTSDRELYFLGHASNFSKNSISKAPGAVAMPWSLWGRRADPAVPSRPAPPAPAAAASAGALSSEPTFEESILSAGFGCKKNVQRSSKVPISQMFLMRTGVQYPSVMFVTLELVHSFGRS